MQGTLDKKVRQHVSLLYHAAGDTRRATRFGSHSLQHELHCAGQLRVLTATCAYRYVCLPLRVHTLLPVHTFHGVHSPMLVRQSSRGDTCTCCTRTHTRCA